MDSTRDFDEALSILDFWYLLEVFSPQSVPPLTPQSVPLAKGNESAYQVVSWKPNDLLPWQALPHRKGYEWKHTVYLGVYDLSAAYQRVYEVFEPNDAILQIPRSTQKSACAAFLVDDDGHLIPDSLVLSSTAWAIGRLTDPGITDAKWPLGFENAQEDFRLGEARNSFCSDEELRDRLDHALDCAGINDLPSIGTQEIYISSISEKIVASKNSNDREFTIDFLNSFFLTGLKNIAKEVKSGNIGIGLKEFLASDIQVPISERIDVIKQGGVIESKTVLEYLPKGRWPTNPEHSLAVSQQFAVNRAVNDLKESSGIMGVNGPPGTGKTTMLRDILAANVVERARRLARLRSPEEAFTGEYTDQWYQGAWMRKIALLRPELTGFEMVVASANNTAVENISVEIPDINSIAEQWRNSSDYFKDIATQMLRSSVESQAETKGAGTAAWGLVAAKLGKKKHRKQFYSDVWFGRKKRDSDAVLPGLQTYFKQWKSGERAFEPWDQACQNFREAEQEVDKLIAERMVAQIRSQEHSTVKREIDGLRDRQSDLRSIISGLKNDFQNPFDEGVETKVKLEETENEYRQHLQSKPSFLKRLFFCGQEAKTWRSVCDKYLQLIDIERDLKAKTEQYAEFLSDITKYGRAHPHNKSNGYNPELCAPWLDNDLNKARSELFLASLSLHESFIANSGSFLEHSLRAAFEVVGGVCQAPLRSEQIRAAWQLFFLVVPLVSTTFASAGRMFRGLGRESIGWLLIDEAGQACPQFAVETIWRAKRTIAVGDPLQLQPVVILPDDAIASLASIDSVSETWCPPRASVQTLADRITRYGTSIDQGESSVWVSAPLRVHRRCDDPMFKFCNKHVYNNMMIQGVVRTGNSNDLFSTDRIMSSRWLEVSSSVAGNHLQPEQIQVLKKLIGYLVSKQVNPSDIIVITPFRVIAERLKSLSEDWKGITSGTVHTAQGREASVVILLLGGDPNKRNTPAVWANSPNFVNVAVSRAKCRLYVIGDRGYWAQHRYFRELDEELGFVDLTNENFGWAEFFDRLGKTGPTG